MPYLCDLPLKIHDPSPIIRRTSDKFQLRGILQIPDIYTLKVSILSKTKEVREIITAKIGVSEDDTKCNAVTYVGSWNRKRALGTSKVINNLVSTWIQ